MAKVELLESFETGHPEIDADHRRMCVIINAIHDALEASLFDDCRRLFDDFLDAAREHFAREERVLREAGFPRVAEHSVYHWRLMERAHEVQKMCAEVTAAEEITACFDKLTAFFIDDIIKGDLDFKSFLHEKGLTNPQVE